MNVSLIKVGTMFYNQHRDHVATITNLTSTEIEYYWRRVGDMELESPTVSRTWGSCYVSIAKFKCLVENKAFKELSTLEMELL